MNSKHRISTTVFFVAALLAALIYWIRSPEGPYAEEGLPAPAIRLTDINGQIASLSHYRGHPIVLDFWATWCDSCREEIPALKTIYSRHHADGLEILAAAVDDEGPRAVIPFTAQNRLPWRVVIADADSARLYRVSGLPTKYLIDRRGKIFRKYLGPVDEPTLERDIEDLLNTPTAL